MHEGFPIPVLIPIEVFNLLNMLYIFLDDPNLMQVSLLLRRENRNPLFTPFSTSLTLELVVCPPSFFFCLEFCIVTTVEVYKKQVSSRYQ